MQISLVNGERRTAFTGGRGTCTICNSPTLAKCGPRIMHHWAHVSRRDCDLWWENETPWHREWKELFPESYREISHTGPDGEIHRADIKTPKGIVIEVQHSSMSDAERLSREAFYQNMVWIVDGAPFLQNFDIYHVLPHPKSELAQDLVWAKATRPHKGAAAGLFFRLSEYCEEHPGATKLDVKSGYIHGIHGIEDQVNHEFRGHLQYDWVRPRQTWLDATCPVYIDLGNEMLARFETYDESGLECVFLVSKKKFVQEAMSAKDAQEIVRSDLYDFDSLSVSQS